MRLKSTVGYSNITVTNRGSMIAKNCGPGKIYYEWMYGNIPSPEEVGFHPGNFRTRRQHTRIKITGENFKIVAEFRLSLQMNP